jgi:hypothetical protein
MGGKSNQAFATSVLVRFRQTATTSPLRFVMTASGWRQSAKWPDWATRSGSYRLDLTAGVGSDVMSWAVVGGPP